MGKVASETDDQAGKYLLQVQETIDSNQWLESAFVYVSRELNRVGSGLGVN